MTLIVERDRVRERTVPRRTAVVTLLHVTDRLCMGGCATEMRNLGLSASKRFRPVLAGLCGDAEHCAELRQAGLEAGVTGPDLRGLPLLIGSDVPFAVLIHRSGERTPEWDAALPALRQHGAQVILERSIFGYPDTGPAARCVDMVLCNSKSTLRRHWMLSGRPEREEYLRRHRVLYNSVLLIPSAEELARAGGELRRELGIPEHAFVVGHVSRPDAMRLDAMMLGVLPRLLRAVPDAWLVGRQYPESMARRLAAVAGGRFVNLPATARQEEIIATYGAMDVLAHLSTMGESFGMAIAEAMRCGLPVVANETLDDRCGNAQCELITNDVTGYLASDPMTLLRRLVGLAGSAAKRKAMGEAAREKFERAPLSPRSVVEQIEGEMTRLLEGRGEDEQAVARCPSNLELMGCLEASARRYIVPPARPGLRQAAWFYATQARRQWWRIVRRIK